MDLTPIDQIPAAVCERIQYIFSDIDDTMTLEGRIPAAAFAAMWAAHEAGSR